MSIALLNERLSLRAKAFVSDPELLTDALLALAVEEALALAGKETALPILLDIAYYRVLLQIGHQIDEVEHRAYQFALKRITDPSATLSPIVASSRQRSNPYQ